MEEEAENFVAKCDKCQRYAPAELLHSVISPWPLMKWGMDIVVPLPQAKVKNSFRVGRLNGLHMQPYHPVANGQAESTNKVIINNLNKRLEESKALIPVEIGEPSTTYTHAIEESNKEEMQMNLDLLEEWREAALIKKTNQKQMIERYYNRKANMRYFKIGDFVLKKAFRSTKAANTGKLSPNWEGPYKVCGIAVKGAMS
uniref:RNA-directed DNA polymerase homolog n=1 Tax=Nicotiana tabacum TaxID=4097 RepID=A0A1S4CPR0_TOBAC|nr:PREDICTED: uncharacterized protein LOC107821318 [Nicotiana tabacum]